MPVVIISRYATNILPINIMTSSAVRVDAVCKLRSGVVFDMCTAATRVLQVSRTLWSSFKSFTYDELYTTADQIQLFQWTSYDAGAHLGKSQSQS